MATTERPLKSSSTSTLGDRVRSLRLPPDPPPATWRRKGTWVLVSVVGLIAAALLYPVLTARVGVEGDAKTSEPTTSVTTDTSTATATDTPPAGVEPAPIDPGGVADSGEYALAATGYIVPAHQLLISPKVSGMIVSLNFEEGQRVEKGEVLAELESVDYKADVARARAVLEATKQRLAELEHGSRVEEVDAAKAELAETETQRDQLYSEFKRNGNLRGNRTVTEREYEQSESSYKAMDRRAARLRNVLKMLEDGPRVERIAAAKADVLEAEAEVAKANWRLGNCTITAPISGTILKKNAEIGNVVNPVAFNGSFSLCEMADLSDLEVDLSIQERSDLSKVHKGQKCKIKAEAFPKRVYDGVVSRLMPIADRAKGAVPVRVKLSVPADEEGVYLKPEMSVVVSFLK